MRFTTNCSRFTLSTYVTRMIGSMSVVGCPATLTNVPSVVLSMHIDLDKKKAAFERRKVRSRLNRTVAKLPTADVAYLNELAERLVERAVKPVLPNIMEDLES